MTPLPVPALFLAEEPCYLDKKEFLEIVDPNCLTALIESDLLLKQFNQKNYAQNYAKLFYQNEKEQLQNYHKKFNTNIHGIIVKYNLPAHKLGRVNPYRALGLTSFRKKIRNTLIEKNYIDIDLCNCQPKILYDICKANNIECNALENLILNRENILREISITYNVSRSFAKKLFIRLCFYGTFKGWRDDNNLDSTFKPNKFICEFVDELKIIAEKIKKANPIMWDKVCEMKKGDVNIIGAFVSYYLQTYECRIISAVIEWLCEKEEMYIKGCSYPVLIYEFDGIKIPSFAILEGVDSLIQQMERVVFERTNFQVKFEVKPIEEDDYFEIEYDPYVPIEKKFISIEDLNQSFQTAELIAPVLKETLILCNEEWYIFNDKTKLWNKQKTPEYYILREIRKYIDYSNHIVTSKLKGVNDEEQRKALVSLSAGYLAGYSKIEKPSYLSVLIKNLKTHLMDNDFSKKLDCNIGKLAFCNGIVDLKTGHFRKGIQYDDFITNTIPYDWQPNKITPEKIDFVRGKLREILNNNEEHLEYFLSIIGFCFIGDADKEKSMYCMIDGTENARGDNGKTFFFDILTHLMPNYVYKSSGTLLEEGNSKIHKQLVHTKGKRLVWVDEFSRTKKLNPRLMKEIADGKKIENEVMFGTSEEINVLFKLFILSNHMIKIDEKEDAVYNRYKQISYSSHFDRTGERTIPNPDALEFIADTKLGDTLKNEYHQEIFSLVINYSKKYYVGGMVGIPSKFAKDAMATKMKNDTWGIWFMENCEIDDDYRVALKKLVDMSRMKEKDVKEGMSRLGFKYDRMLKGVSLGTYIEYDNEARSNIVKNHRGGYRGVRIIERVEEEGLDLY